MNNEKLVILLVDDSSIITDRLKAMLLELENVQSVLEARTYEEAFRLLDQDLAQVLVLDLNLPDRNGLDILRSIGLQKSELTIIVLTNQTDQYYRKISFAMGADHFLDKTKDFDRVISIIQQLQPSHNKH